VGGTWAAGAGKGSERGGRLSQITRRGLEDAVVIDNSDVGTGGRLGLRQEKARRQEKSGGLGTEDATSGCHVGLSVRRKSITMGDKMPQQRMSLPVVGLAIGL